MVTVQKKLNVNQQRILIQDQFSTTLGLPEMAV